MERALIYDAVRTPRGRGKAATGSLAEIPPVELAAAPLAALRDRNHLDTSGVDDIVLGCVDPVHDQGADIARTAALVAGYHETVPGVQINRFCASGLEACAMAAAKVETGEAELAIGGGVEMMSRIPMLSSGAPMLSDPSIAMPMAMVPQGISADLIATRNGHARADVDAYAVESHKRATHAWAQGRFADSVIPVTDRNGLPVLDRDETIRPDANMQSMASLDPAFETLADTAGFGTVAMRKYPEIERLAHVHHAGNSSQIVDGAAAVLIGSPEAGLRHDLTPRARIRSVASIGSEPTIMLTGPTAACEKALRIAGVARGDIDLWELNEAFASVVLNFLEENDLDPAVMNVNGGAIAMGHPLGATGAMLVSTMVDELHRADKALGVVTLCAASGMAIAMVIERMETVL
ncbi:MAG: acetyl-CoA C-acetyltransferase [Pseudomonadota bacterium]